MSDTFKNKLILKYPAAWWGAKWREALPSGNGTIGAAVYGAVNEETILLTHEGLWWKSKTPELPIVSDKLPEVRRLLLDNKAKEADHVLAQTLKDRGYQPKIAAPLPLGDLKVKMPGKRAFSNYRRILDMETGEVAVLWQDGETTYERHLFVSRTDNMVVYEIRASGPDLIEAFIALDLHDRSDVKRPGQQPASKLPGRLETYAKEGYIYYAAQNDDGTDFGAVARVVHQSGRLTNDHVGIHASDTQKVLVCLKLFIGGDREKEWKRLKNTLDKTGMHYTKLLKPHTEKHGELFNRMSLDLFAAGHERSNEQLLFDAYQGEAPEAMIEKMWAYGRYLLVSSTGRDSQPCHLYGLWCGEYEGMWAFHMVNENLQMIYWQALAGNLPEMLLAVFDYFDNSLDDFRTNARQLYGCRGIYIPAPTAPDSGLLKHVMPHIIHWTGGAGWVAQHYYDYFLHTGDRTFLHERALPFLKETALFYEDFFIVGENGFYISSPSNSPENAPGNLWDGNGMGAKLQTTMNATMDFAIAKEVLIHLIEGSRIAGIYPDEIGKWEAMLERIPPYELNEDGAVKEWMHPYYEDNYHHRHQSHIYPVFPGTEVNRSHDPELFEGFVTAVKKRLVIGLKEQSGWSLAHMANNYARMGEGDLALECLDIMSRSCVMNNFYTTANDWRGMGVGVTLEWAPFQIDANMGWSAAMQEMLLFSLPGEIHILPALPKRWYKGEVKGMLARGGIEVSMEWNQERVSVELCSLHKDQVIDVIPFGIQSGEDRKQVIDKKVHAKLKLGQKQVITFQRENEKNAE